MMNAIAYNSEEYIKYSLYRFMYELEDYVLMDEDSLWSDIDTAWMVRNKMPGYTYSDMANHLIHYDINPLKTFENQNKEQLDNYTNRLEYKELRVMIKGWIYD